MNVYGNMQILILPEMTGMLALEADGKPQPRLIAIEMDEIEGTRTSRRRAPGLSVPCCGNECVFAKFGVESRAEIERLPREIVQRQPLILTEVARLEADENAVHR